MKKKSKRKKIGRSAITVDWALIDEMLEAGCPGADIATAIGISANTLYDYCPRYKKMSFSDYAAMKKAAGEGNIRLGQYREAKQGNITMLIFLGKNRLGQRDTFNQGHNSDQKIADLRVFAADLGFSSPTRQEVSKDSSPIPIE